MPSSLTALALLAALLAACGGRGDEGAPESASAGGVSPPASASGASSPAGPGPVPAPGAPSATAGSETQSPLRPVTLYFATGTGALRAETREIPSEGSPVDQARIVVEALVEGPREPLVPVIPRGAALRAFYLGDDGTAFVDFDSGFSRGLSAGSEDALLALWSITDTLAVNFAEIKAVKFLVEGEEVEELGGHLDLSRPLVPDMSLVEGAGGSAEERP